MIEVRGLTKRHGSAVAVDRLRLAVYAAIAMVLGALILARRDA